MAQAYRGPVPINQLGKPGKFAHPGQVLTQWFLAQKQGFLAEIPGERYTNHVKVWSMTGTKWPSLIPRLHSLLLNAYALPMLSATFSSISFIPLHSVVE